MRSRSNASPPPGPAGSSLAPPAGPVCLLTNDLLEAGTAASRASLRGRIIQILQRDPNCQVQRLLNFMQPGSYVQPHCHPMPHAIETVTPLKGALHAWIFNDAGQIILSRTLRAGDPSSCLIDIESGVWHTFTAAEPDTVVLEIKCGPYDANTDKRFAPWAPSESEPTAPGYLRRLIETNGE